jgi:hypothetical protein
MSTKPPKLKSGSESSEASSQMIGASAEAKSLLAQAARMKKGILLKLLRSLDVINKIDSDQSEAVI